MPSLFESPILIAGIGLVLAIMTGLVGYGLASMKAARKRREEVRRLRMENDMVNDQLAGTQTELDELYAAVGRFRREREALKSGHGEGSAALQAQLDALKAELAAAREASKTQTFYDAAALGDEGDLDAGLDPEEASLEWRNRYLEARVRELEQAKDQVSETEDDGLALPDRFAAAETALKSWQTRHLRQRVESLEGELVRVRGRLAESASEAVSALDSGGTGSAGEEAARLRWRNRYLESRVAYYEEGRETAPASAPGMEPKAPVRVGDLAAASKSAASDEPEHPSDIFLRILERHAENEARAKAC